MFRKFMQPVMARGNVLGSYQMHTQHWRCPSLHPPVFLSRPLQVALHAFLYLWQNCPPSIFFQSSRELHLTTSTIAHFILSPSLETPIYCAAAQKSIFSWVNDENEILWYGYMTCFRKVGAVASEIYLTIITVVFPYFFYRGNVQKYLNAMSV